VIEEKVIGAHGKGPSVKGEETKWCRRKKCEEKITGKRKGKGEEGEKEKVGPENVNYYSK
jgi:hypothetical protein